MEKDKQNSCQILNQICQYSNLIKKIKFFPVENKNQYYECEIQILNKNTQNTLKADICLHIYKNTGLGKKKAKQLAALRCIKSPEISSLIKNMNYNKNIKNQQLYSTTNNYIEWGKKIINNEYKLYINNIDYLKKINNYILAVDSEGFSNDGKYPSMIQIADDKTVLIFDYKRYHHIIKPFLLQKKIILYGAKNDLKHLKLNTSNYIDIQQMYNNKSLKKSASLLTNNNIIFQKPHGTFYMYKNWLFDNLDDNHIYYAATDAIITYKLYTHRKDLIPKLIHEN
tara:strand:+ start:142 stop:990 length:849 start_codon:yes stop_codon:yes gene_type:complete